MSISDAPRAFGKTDAGALRIFSGDRLIDHTIRLGTAIIVGIALMHMIVARYRNVASKA